MIAKEKQNDEWKSKERRREKGNFMAIDKLTMFALFGKGVARKDTMWYQTGE
jgi:hypothetical protein